jgi:hypothetical protein
MKPPLPHTTLTRQGRSLRLDMSTLESPELSTLLRGPHMRSPYEVLMHTLTHVSPQESRWWSRGRAVTTEAISPAMWGVMKVAGKRLATLDLSGLACGASSDDEGRVVNEMTRVTTQDIKTWATRLANVKRPPLTGARYTSVIEAGQALNEWVTRENTSLEERGLGERQTEGRRWGGARRVVGALALNRAGVVISAALNRPEISFTAHAEWCLLDDLWRRDAWPPDGEVTLISSLKPCKLCAGAWVTHAPYSSLSVHVLRDDPGPNGQHTAFDELSYAQGEARRWRSDWGSLSQTRLSLGGDS